MRLLILPDGSKWPDPRDLEDLMWRLRYAPLGSCSDLYDACLVMEAYMHLIEHPGMTKGRLWEKVKGLRKAMESVP